MNELPVIDIAPLLDPERRDEWPLVDATIGDAIEMFGGFVVSGYPQAEMVDQWARTALRFYELDDHRKRQVATRVTEPTARTVYRGYRSSLRPGEWAYNEMFDTGPAHPYPAPDIVGMHVFAEENVWPEPEPCEGWQAAMESYYELMQRIGMAVMLSAGRWAGFDDADLQRRFSEGNSTLRLLNYPVKPADWPIDPNATFVDGRPIAAVRHTDVAGVSLLWQREGGLQAQAPDGTWRDVPLIPNAISVHLGTVLDVMTDGRVRATPHRVIDGGTHRQSIGFFVEPGLAASVGPLAGVDGTDDVRHSYGWHLQQRFSTMRGYQQLVPPPALP
jgi:isopenicillin N synthase-like dioxygenase